jgi:hypothetical protein
MRAISCLFLLLAMAAGGCATQSYAARTDRVVAAFADGRYLAAAEAASELAARVDDPRRGLRGPPPRDGLIYRLEEGAAWRAAGDIDGSIAAFDRALILLREIDASPVVRISEEAVATLANPTSTLYRGTQVDRVMLATYQTLNHLEAGAWETARNYARLTLEEQQLARQRFDRAVEEARRDAERAAARAGDNYGRLIERAGLSAAELEAGRFDDFRNAYADVVAAVTLLETSVRASQRETARVALRAALRQAPNNNALRELVETTRPNRIVTAGVASPPRVYVFYERGLAPSREVEKTEIPLFLLGGSVGRLGTPALALPRLRLQPGGVDAVLVGGGRTERLASFDRLVADEFEVVLPGIVSRAMTSLILKAVAAAAASKVGEEVGREVGGVGGALIQIGGALAGPVYQLSTNEADLRTWRTLPKEAQLAVVDRPASGKVPLMIGQFEAVVELPDGFAAYIIFVKQPRRGVPPTVRYVPIPIDARADESPVPESAAGE